MNMKLLSTFLIVCTLFVYAVTTGMAEDTENEPNKAETGKLAPSIIAKTVHDKEFDLKKLRGKVVLVDFWGTWCPPCKEELPHLREAYEKFHKKGFEIVSVALRDNAENVKSFSKNHEMTWTHIIDEGFKLATKYQVQVVPTPFLLDHTGKIVLRGSEDMFDSDLRSEQLIKDVENYVNKIPENEASE